MSEGFEGPGFENSGWIIPPNSSSIPDPDYTASALQGSESLRCTGVSFIQRPFVRNAPFHCYVRVRWSAWSDYKFVVDWLDASQSSTATLMTSFGHKLEIKHGSVSVPGTTLIALNTTYHVWLEWTPGTGNNGTMKLFVSTTGTKPASPEVSIVNGNGDSTESFDVGPFGAGVDVVYDSILIDDEVIGSNPAGNAPPTISAITNQSTPASTATPAIPFTIGDRETNATDLTVTGSSSDQGVIPDAGIVFGGSESNRTVTLTPAANQSGVTTITLTVSDGASTSSTSFTVTVGTVNTAPSISGLANQSTPIDTPTAAIAFIIGDAQTAAGSLGVTGSSLNPALVPNGNIVFGGSGSNRTVTITPAAGQTGTTTISIRVNDGQLTNATSFTLVVGSTNTAPTLSAISSQSTPLDTPLGPVHFTIGDVETPAADLTLIGSSSNPALIPNENLSFGGSAHNRRVTITPAAGQSGTSTITVIVSDGELTASRSFLVNVIPNGTGSPSGLLFEEGFEGAGYENAGWSKIGQPNPDYAAAPLRGTQSMRLSEGEFIYRTFVATNNFSLYMQANWKKWADYIGFIYLETAEYGAAGSLFADNNVLQINHGSASSMGTTIIETNTTYHIWIEWNRGTGGDGTMNLFVSTSVIKPGVPEATLNLGDGGNIEKIYFGSFSQGFDVVMDSLFFDNEPIGSNPQSNLPPTISNLADHTINEDSTTDSLAFTVGDVESAASSLTLVGTSSSPALVPNAGIVFGGSGSNRTVTVTPAPNQFGTATITITVRDGSLETNDTFLLTVSPINDQPVVTLLGGPASFTQGSAPVVLSAAGTVVDIDSATLGGGQLSVSITANASPEDRLAIRNQGVGPGEIEVSGIGLAYAGVGVGTFAGGTDGSTPLIISFNSSATPESAQALLRNITFQNVSDTPSTLPRTISVVVQDGHGGTSAVVNMTVNVVRALPYPTINWPAPAPIAYGTPLTAAQQNATASVPGTFVYSPLPNTVLNAGSGQTLSLTFTPTDSENFNPVTTNVLINVTPAALQVTAQNKSKVYGAANPALTATLTGFVNGDTEASLDTPVTLATLADAASPAGTYAITATAADANYTMTFVPGTLTVTPAALLVTANNTGRAYGQTNPLFSASITGFVNGDDQADLLGTLAFSTLAETNSPIGQYVITPAGLSSPNYVVNFIDGTLNVTAYALVVTADNKSKIYGADLPALTGTVVGVHEGDGITATFTTAATATSNAGPHLITAVLSDPNNQLTNYTVTLVNGTLTITPASLLVTAENKSKVYGAANPALTATYSGFVNGDTVASLDTPVSLTTLADAASPAGDHFITPTAAADVNYTVTFAPGTLTVTRAPLLATAANKSKAFGATNPVLTATFTGFVNGDTEASLDTPVTLTTPADATSPVGAYTITAAAAGDANYTVTFAPGALTVTPAPLLVTAANKSKIYGMTNPVLTATYVGFVNGDTEVSLDTPVTLTTTATTASPVGTHVITVSGAANVNYDVTHVTGTLTVTPAGPLLLAIVSADALGNATMRITSDPGQRVKVQGSVNLTNWLDLTTVTNTSGTIDYTDSVVAQRPHRYYRAVLAPE